MSYVQKDGHADIQTTVTYVLTDDDLMNEYQKYFATKEKLSGKKILLKLNR